MDSSPDRHPRSGSTPLNPGSKLRIYPWQYELAFLLFAILVVILASYSIWQDYRETRHYWLDRMSSVADDRARMISNWLVERRADAEIAAANPSVLSLLSGRAWTKSTGHEKESIAHLLPFLNQLAFVAYNYKGVYVVDPAGMPLAWSSEAPELSAQARAACRDAVRDGEFRVHVLGKTPQDSRVFFTMPVISPEGTKQPTGRPRRFVGAVGTLIDPSDNLFRFVTAEAVPTRTGETVLTLEDANEVVLFSPLRHVPAGAPFPRYSLQGSTLPAVLALKGIEASEEFADYRGVRVVAAMRRTRLAGWGLVHKMDRDEVMEGYRRTAWLKALAAALTVLASGGLLFAHRRALLTLVLKREGGKFRSLLESAPDSMVVANSEGRILLANLQTDQQFGYAREELLGQPIEILVAQPSRPEYCERFHRHSADLSHRHSGPCMVSLGLRKNGSEFFMEVLMTPLESAEGILIINALRDITKRKRVEEALRESEEHFRSFVENAPLGVYRTTPDGRVLMANPALLRMLGYDSWQELASRNLEGEAFEAGYPRSAFREQIEREGEVRGLEAAWKRRDGSVVFVRGSARAFRANDGSVLYYDGTFEDVTEHRQLEEQLRQAQKMEAVGRLAGGVAHDFNNLLTIVIGYSDLLLKKLTACDGMRLPVGEIKKAGERAALLTRQLLAFSRKQVLQPQILDLNSLLTNLDEMLQRVIGEDIELVTHLPSGPCRVKADPGQIEQVIMNLAVNARDAMPQGGQLTLEAANVELDSSYASSHESVLPGHYVMIAMSDTGIGMDAETQAHIFEPFFTTKEQGKGTGLGLATVHGIVKQSGGSIRVYSEPGKGTTFKVYLPRIDQAVEVIAPTNVPVDELSRGSETILLAEDEEAVRSFARGLLESRGYEVLEAKGAHEALEVGGRYKKRIHLLLTDVVMPHMSGAELVKHLAPLHPETKVLYMSGYADHAVVHHGLLDPGTVFLQKPFTPHTLARKLREVLDSVGAQRA